MRAPAARQPGFTLIEIAVVLFIIVLVLGSILVPLTTQVEQRQVSDTEKTLSEIREALLGFAVANGYLPCPDKTTALPGGGTANDGVEDVVAGTGACVATNEGNVPWATLGVGPVDVWGNRFRYQVNSNFSTRSPGATFTLTSTSNIIVCSASACGATARYTSDAVAVIISLGRNGYGAINSNTGTANTAPTSADEIQNQAGPSQFMSRTRSPLGSAAGEFDDVVVWLPRSVLFNRMVAAGKLP